MKSFLTDYLKYTQFHEAPDQFHLWCGITAVASALGRSVFIDCMHYKLYPNLYVILVGKSGLRKSSAVKQAKELLEAVPKVVLIHEKITPAKLLTDLSTASKIRAVRMALEEDAVMNAAEATVITPEMGVFIGREAYISGLITDLTTLYDCPDEWPYKTKSQGVFYLYNVWLSILGATTFRDFSYIVPPDALGSGFAARLNVVVGTAPRKRPLFHSEDTIRQREELRASLEERLIKISKLEGPAGLDRASKEFLESWYASRARVLDERLESYEEREHDLIMKLALIRAAAERQDLSICLQDVSWAMEVVEGVKKGMREAYTHVGDHKYTGHLDRVLRQVRARGRVTWQQLVQLNWYNLTKDDLREVVDTLVAAGYVKETLGKKSSIFWAVNPEDVRE